MIDRAVPSESFMRALITIERLPTSNGSYLIGRDAFDILASIDGVSAITIEKQFIDRATLSYVWADRSHDFTSIDNMLHTKGMRRVV
jgi:hypothetical protein